MLHMTPAKLRSHVNCIYINVANQMLTSAENISPRVLIWTPSSIQDNRKFDRRTRDLRHIATSIEDIFPFPFVETSSCLIALINPINR